MRIGYSTAEFREHQPDVAVKIIQDLGYKTVVLRLSSSFNPLDSARFESQFDAVCSALRPNVRVILDTSGRFLLDPRQASGPSLADVSESDANKRSDLIRRTISVAERLGNCPVIFSSGFSGEEEEPEVSLNRLAERVDALAGFAVQQRVPLALQPEAGALVATVAQYERLLQWISEGSSLELAGDFGAMGAQGELPAIPILSRIIERVSCLFLPTEGVVDVGHVQSALLDSGFCGDLIVGAFEASPNPVLRARDAFERFSRPY